MGQQDWQNETESLASLNENMAVQMSTNQKHIIDK